MQLLKHFSVLLLWVVLISVLSLMPSGSFNESIFLFKHQDKVIHFVFYFIYALLFHRFLFKVIECRLATMALISGVVPVVFSGIIEITQEYLISNRHADFFDFIFNIAGAVAGVYLYQLVIRQRFFKLYVKEFS